MNNQVCAKRGKERLMLRVNEWPEADRLAWEEACRPSHRLKRGGSASHLGPVSRKDIASRYGLFLGFLKRTARLDLNALAAAQVTPPHVETYTAELSSRVSSVTAWNCIYKLRRAAELLAPNEDFIWLAEIEKDLALVMEPRSKLDHLVLTEQLLEAGLTRITEAKDFARTNFARARGIRNGLMLALLALCPIRRKNFAALEIDHTFKQIRGRWWITLPGGTTKAGSPEEHPIAAWLTPYIDLYLNEARPVLLDTSKSTSNALWISSVTRQPMTEGTIWKVITQITRETLGIAISPHLFRTAEATTAADARPDIPHLASALLGHKHARVTEEHYNRASSLIAANDYAAIVRQHYGPGVADS